MKSHSVGDGKRNMDSEDFLYENPYADPQDQEACTNDEDYHQDHGGLDPLE